MRGLPCGGGAGSGSVQWRWQWRPWETTCGAETHSDLVEMAGVIGIIRVRIELVAGLGMHLRRGQATACSTSCADAWGGGLDLAEGPVRLSASWVEASDGGEGVDGALQVELVLQRLTQ